MSGGARIRLDAHGPFDHRAALWTLVAHAVDGLHLLETASAAFTRWVDVGGVPHRITVFLDAGGATVTTETGDAGVDDAIAARVRHWFDLDADIARIDAHLGADDVFAAQVRQRPGLRITRFHSPFEALVLIVLGQQVSLAAGRLFAHRLVAACGRFPRPGSAGRAGHPAGGLRLFPAAAEVAALGPDALRESVGLTGARARTLHTVADLVAQSPDGASLPAPDQLREVRGIGPWTLACLALRTGADDDAFPASDAVLRRALAQTGTAVDAERIASWSPHRGYAASRLWASVGSTMTP